MSFDFRYTCSEIDEQIDGFKDELEDNLHDLNEVLKDIVPANCKDDLETAIKEFKEATIESSKEGFEVVRALNVEMRDSATEQLDDLQRDKDDVDEYLKDAENKIQELENQLVDLQGEYDSLIREYENA